MQAQRLVLLGAVLARLHPVLQQFLARHEGLDTVHSRHVSSGSTLVEVHPPLAVKLSHGCACGKAVPSFNGLSCVLDGCIQLRAQIPGQPLECPALPPTSASEATTAILGCMTPGG